LEKRDYPLFFAGTHPDDEDFSGYYCCCLAGGGFSGFRLFQRLLEKADCGSDMLGQKFAAQPLTCLQSGRCRKHVAGEYLKIAWFLVYSWFV